LLERWVAKIHIPERRVVGDTADVLESLSQSVQCRRRAVRVACDESVTCGSVTLRRSELDLKVRLRVWYLWMIEGEEGVEVVKRMPLVVCFYGTLWGSFSAGCQEEMPLQRQRTVDNISERSADTLRTAEFYAGEVSQDLLA
jgi:hypothetical protein